MSRRSSSTSGGADKVAIVNFTKGLAAMVAELGIEDDRLHWVAEIAGVRREWDATILEQVPDTKVAWAVTEGATNAGAVYFDGAGLGRTPVRLVLEYEPEGLVEHAGDALGVIETQAQLRPVPPPSHGIARG